MNGKQKHDPLSKVEICYFKPDHYKPRDDALDIFIGDFTLHSQTANSPKSLLHNHYKEYRGGKRRRTFVNGGVVAKDDGSIEMGFDIDPKEVDDILKRMDKKRLRIMIPEAGVPIFLGRDAIEKAKALQKQKPLKK